MCLNLPLPTFLLFVATGVGTMKWPLSIQLSMVTGTSPQSHNGPKFTPTPRFTSHWGFTISLRNFVFPYRPQSSLKQTLIKLSIKLSLDWTKLLLALVKLRALPQKPLQFSLLEVMFGRTSAILGLEISPPPLPPTCLSLPFRSQIISMATY